ncbi:MAG: S4 domain-containing protein [Candidatus Cloacimonadota bacterium]|nr:S4 domain-containing protein [Candidatus Cloacimonadota bacterium]
MRIDKLMNKLCLIKTRSIAKKAADKNLILVNKKLAKASQKIVQDDVIDYQIYGYKTKIKVIKMPDGNVSKKKAPEFYEIISREKIDIN